MTCITFNVLTDDYAIAADDLEDLQLYRNLALSRLVKKAAESAAFGGGFGSGGRAGGYLAARSGSKTPQLSALWKTRVG